MLKRPLCIATVCYMIGIVMGLYLKISIVFLLCFFILSLILLLLFFSKKKKFAFFLIAIFLGVICIRHIDKTYEEQYRLLKENTKYLIEAVIVSEPIEKEYKIVYEIEIKHIEKSLVGARKRWLLNVKKSNSQISQEKMQFGDYIQFMAIIEIPSCARNYMGFDYQKYLKTQKIYGTMISDGEIEIVRNNQCSFFHRALYSIKKNMKENVYLLLPEGVRELCLGILIGNRKDIEEEITANFSESNLSHMLAVSGAHVSYMILILTSLFQKIRCRLRKIFISIFLIFFMALTGFTPSVERACTMMILSLVAGLMHRKQDTYTSLCLSCFGTLLMNPYAILNIGFQLSYGCTLGILLFQRRIAKCLFQYLGIDQIKCNNSQMDIVLDRKTQTAKWVYRIKKYVGDTVAVSISANLAIVPIIGFWFHKLSFTFGISNLLAGPLLGLIIIGGFCLYVISLVFTPAAIIIAFGLKYLLYLLMFIAQICSKIPFSSIIIRTPYYFEILFYYLILFILYHFSYFKKRIFNIICIILIIMIACYSVIGITSFGYLEIHFIDIGQGDCTFIHTPSNQSVLIDGGGSEVGGFDVGEKTLLPYLLNKKITKIDYMFISHFDTDHVGRIALYHGKNKSKKCSHRKTISRFSKLSNIFSDC